MTDLILLTVFVAGCAYTGGYAFGRSMAFEGWRQTLDNWGTEHFVAYEDMAAHPEDYPTRWRRLRRLRRLAAFKFADGVTCQVCSGWWWAAAAVALLAWVINHPVPHPAWWALVWGTGCAVHTHLTDGGHSHTADKEDNR